MTHLVRGGLTVAGAFAFTVLGGVAYDMLTAEAAHAAPAASPPRVTASLNLPERSLAAAPSLLSAPSLDMGRVSFAAVPARAPGPTGGSDGRSTPWGKVRNWYTLILMENVPNPGEGLDPEDQRYREKVISQIAARRAATWVETSANPTNPRVIAQAIVEDTLTYRIAMANTPRGLREAIREAQINVHNRRVDLRIAQRSGNPKAVSKASEKLAQAEDHLRGVDQKYREHLRLTRKERREKRMESRAPQRQPNPKGNPGKNPKHGPKGGPKGGPTKGGPKGGPTKGDPKGGPKGGPTKGDPKGGPTSPRSPRTGPKPVKPGPSGGAAERPPVSGQRPVRPPARVQPPVRPPAGFQRPVRPPAGVQRPVRPPTSGSTPGQPVRPPSTPGSGTTRPPGSGNNGTARPVTPGNEAGRPSGPGNGTARPTAPGNGLPASPEPTTPNQPARPPTSGNGAVRPPTRPVGAPPPATPGTTAPRTPTTPVPPRTPTTPVSPGTPAAPLAPRTPTTPLAPRTPVGPGTSTPSVGPRTSVNASGGAMSMMQSLSTMQSQVLAQKASQEIQSRHDARAYELALAMLKEPRIAREFLSEYEAMTSSHWAKAAWGFGNHQYKVSELRHDLAAFAEEVLRNSQENGPQTPAGQARTQSQEQLLMRGVNPARIPGTPEYRAAQAAANPPSEADQPKGEPAPNGGHPAVDRYRVSDTNHHKNQTLLHRDKPKRYGVQNAAPDRDRGRGAGVDPESHPKSSPKDPDNEYGGRGHDGPSGGAPSGGTGGGSTPGGGGAPSSPSAGSSPSNSGGSGDGGGSGGSAGGGTSPDPGGTESERGLGPSTAEGGRGGSGSPSPDERV